MATFLQSHKPFKSDEQDMRSTAEETRTNSEATFSNGRASVDRPTRSYKHRLGANTVCFQEDMPGAMGDRDGWRESQ